MPDSGLPSPAPASDVRISTSRGLDAFLDSHKLSFGFTSYRTGFLYLVGLVPDGRISLNQRAFERVMGVHADENGLTIATAWQIWTLSNTLQPGEQLPDGTDAFYVPRGSRVTGDIDAHDVALDDDGHVLFVNTKYSCLATLADNASFRPIWTPPFISKLAGEDRCHLNGFCLEAGKPKFATAVSTSDSVSGWREKRSEGGCLIDVQSNHILAADLSMPHSPRISDGWLYLLNSGHGTLCEIDRENGHVRTIAELPGFLRGLSIHDNYAFVGLSLPRDGNFAGLPLSDRLSEKDIAPWCGVQIIDLRTGDIVHWLRFDSGVDELFDVFVLPGVRRPMALGILNDEVRQHVIY